MGELGPQSPQFHRETGEHASAVAVDCLIGVGAPARDYGPDDLVGHARRRRPSCSPTQLGPGDAVLVKGSRSAGMEAVAEALEELIGD